MKPLGRPRRMHRRVVATLERIQAVSMLRWVPAGMAILPTAVLPLAFLPLMGMAAAAAPTSALEPALERTQRQLRQVWQSQPLTTSLPFPAVELLPAGTEAAQACPATSAYCAATASVRLERPLLQNSFDIYEQGGVAFWVARGLAEAILASRTDRPPLPSRAANLRSTCLAGTLLGLISTDQPAQLHDLLQQSIKTARVAYAPSLSSRQGIPGQRAYALLTGTGGTRLSCSEEHMALLARFPQQVPDADLFDTLTTNRDPIAPLDGFCIAPPMPKCPLRPSTSLGLRSI